MTTPLWNLDKMMQDAEDRSLISDSLQRLDGRSKAEVATELLKRCYERDARLEQDAIDAERAGDHEGTWMAMATRKENQRFINKLTQEIASMQGGGVSSPIEGTHGFSPAQPS